MTHPQIPNAAPSIPQAGNSKSRKAPRIRYRGNWALVTGASSGLGREIARRLAERGMSLVLTGRNAARLDETASQVRSAVPGVEIDLVVADLATKQGVAELLAHVGERPIEVLANNAGFGTYGMFAAADAAREDKEIAVDVAAVVSLARAFLPGMKARGSGGILNVASTISFQPAPSQAVYGASKAFVLSFSEALWGEARSSGVAVTALCPGPTRTGFVEALGADVGHTAIYSRLAEPGPVVDAGLRALDKGRAVVVPGIRNKLLAFAGRFMPREWLTLFTARLLGAAEAAPRPSIVVDNKAVIPAPVAAVWDLLTDVERWPSWYKACRWVRPDAGKSDHVGASFRWKAHPVALDSTVVAADRHRRFAFTAAGTAVHAEREFALEPTPDGSGTIITSHETQTGWMPRLGWFVLGPRLCYTNRRFFVDLAVAASGSTQASGETRLAPA
jgi:short-subunit dehydrogenase